MPPFEYYTPHQNQNPQYMRRVVVGALRGGRVLALVMILGAILAPAVAQPAQTVRPQADFNNDGFADLAVGAPGEALWFAHPIPNVVEGAGVVHVVYGSGGGVVPAAGNLLLHRETQTGSAYPPAGNAGFGRALAWGDFNADGYDDLAVGVPGDVGGRGRVDIYNGSDGGLYPIPAQYWEERAVSRDRESFGFGGALAVGDINGDGLADLAISCSNFGFPYQKGGLYVLYGTTDGLSAASFQFLDHFQVYGPSSLEIADFNGDGFGELAMGLPYELATAGCVMVAQGTPYGLDTGTLRVLTQDSPDLPGIVENGDYFGLSIAAADFNRDGFWDLAIGVPGENKRSGIVHVMFGQKTGLELSNNQIWSQDNPDVQDEAEDGDHFGASLVAGNFNGDLFPELAVGVPGEDKGTGVVHILTIVAGPVSKGHQLWSQGSPEILGGPEEGDLFGSSLVAGNFDGSGSDDLAIGVPNEAHGEKAEIPYAGAVNVLFGHLFGLQSGENQILMQGFEGMHETGEKYDRFGSL